MNYQQLRVRDFLNILSTCSLILSSIALPSLAISYTYLSREWHKYKKSDIHKMVRRLHKQELLTLKEKDGNIEVELSSKGEIKLLRYDFENLKLKRKRDGNFRTVIFDIPNKKKTNRDMFRKKLIEMGFKRMQESVFITPYPCSNEIEFLTSFLEISPYVILFQINKFELGDEYKLQTIQN